MLITSDFNREKNNYYYNIFLEKCSFKESNTQCIKWMFLCFKWMFVYYKCYIMIELMFLEELTLIKQANQKSAIFANIDIFYIKALSFNQMSAMDVMIY